MPFCQKCGESYRDGEQFCPKCGSRTAPQAAATAQAAPVPTPSAPKEVKKITVSGILAWIIGILFLLTGAGAMAASPAGGMLTILGSLVLLPPTNTFLRKRMNIELSGWIRVILFLVLVGIGLSMGGLDRSDGVVEPTAAPGTDAQETAPATTETAAEEPKQQVHYAGEKVVVGNFAYTINSVSTTAQIGENLMGTFIGEKADGIFLVLDVTIENVAKESKTLWDSNIKVIDDQGRTFEHDIAAEIYLKEGTGFTFEQMQPGLPKTGKIIFDVPADLKGMLIVSSDSMFSDETKYISWNRKE